MKINDELILIISYETIFLKRKRKNARDSQ